MKEVYVITGASSGIGYELCHYLAKLNKSIVAIARRKDKVDQLKSFAPKLITTIVADLSKQSDRDKVIEHLSAVNKILGLVNNAASCDPVTTLENISLADWHQQININLDAPMFLTQGLLPLFNAGSRIINVTTGATRLVSTGIAAYAMTKAALNSYTKYLSNELQPRGILVTAAHPGIVKTDMVNNMIELADPGLNIITAQRTFQKRNLYLEAGLSAKFLTWLLLEADETIYTGDIIGIYNKKYQPLWHSAEIPSPYPEGIDPP